MTCLILQIEGHGGLLVHGPLQATLMLNLASQIHGKQPQKMAYRGLARLFAAPRSWLMQTRRARWSCLLCAGGEWHRTMTADVTP